MKKFLSLIILMLLTSCAQLQVPICSAVTNITVIKTQVSAEETTMSGSQLEDIAKGMKQEAGDIDATQNKKE